MISSYFSMKPSYEGSQRVFYGEVRKVIPKSSLSALLIWSTGQEVIKLEYILKLKIKQTDWLLPSTCSEAANQCALFCV